MWTIYYLSFLLLISRDEHECGHEGQEPGCVLEARIRSALPVERARIHFPSTSGREGGEWANPHVADFFFQAPPLTFELFKGR